MTPRMNDYLAGRGREIVWTTLDTIDPKPVKWLWRPYLPLGKVVVIAGAPGHGKSQLAAFLAAMTTRAGFWPSDVTEPSRAVIVSAEDDLGDTVVPRLLAANADVRLVESVSARRAYPKYVVDGMVSLPGDVEAIHDRLSKGDVRLLVFDPVPAFFDRTHSTLSNQDVRDVLDPLKYMAEQHRTTVAVVLHLNKAAEIREWSARVAESHGFQAVARTVLVLGPDPDDDEGEAGVHKILALPKSNLVRKFGQSLRLEVQAMTVTDRAGAPIETARVVMRELCEVSADDLLMSDDQRRSVRDARAWLLDYLGDQWHKVGQVRSAALREGHHWRTVERARVKVTKTAKQTGVQHGPWWMAATSTPSLGPGTGVLDGLGDNSAKTTRTGYIDADQDSQDRQDDQDRQDNVTWLRERDRRLGEPWGDDE